jgi:hypothetical protein
MGWPLGKKKKKVISYVNGKMIEEKVPDKIPELEIPVPQPPQEENQKSDVVQLSAEEVYEEGRSVGFQEGMIHSLNHLNAEIVRIQDGIRKKIEMSKVK